MFESLFMRWQNLQLQQSEPEAATLPLALPGAVVRNFDTPDFQGITCYEIRAKSIINRVPGDSRMPFQWTLNPYRGCTHACNYCFARKTHNYLDLDSGHDFDSRIIVKVNAPELLRKELSAASWQGDALAMGTNVDPYQRAEGRYQLMRGILGTLRDYANPFSILTKGTLVLRDLDLLSDAAGRADVRVSVSVGFVDQSLWRQVESGAPSPQARLKVCRALTDAGIRSGVLMAPILPFLTDSDDQLEATVAAIAKTGADSVTPLVLHLRPGAREWYLGWLGGARPDLLPKYERLYGRGAYASGEYSRAITARVKELARAYGIGAGRPSESRRTPPATVAERPLHARRCPTFADLMCPEGFYRQPTRVIEWPRECEIGGRRARSGRRPSGTAAPGPLSLRRRRPPGREPARGRGSSGGAAHARGLPPRQAGRRRAAGGVVPPAHRTHRPGRRPPGEALPARVGRPRGDPAAPVLRRRGRTPRRGGRGFGRRRGPPGSRPPIRPCPR